MTRATKRGLVLVAVVMFSGVFAGVISIAYCIVRHPSGSNMSSTSRRLSEEELAKGLKHLNSDILIHAGFRASEYGGWHGDGGSITIYLVEPSDVEKLVVGLKNYHESRKLEWPNHYDYEWSRSSLPDLNFLDKLIPKEFKPVGDEYLRARSSGGSSKISIGLNSGYVCFATSQT